MATTSRQHDPRYLRLGARAALGAGLAWLSLAVSVDRVFGSRAPDMAARWGLDGATANAARAQRLIQPGASTAALNEAQRLAASAVAREPVSVAAISALAQVAAFRGDLKRADRLFNYSERLSRRDLFTQTWLIEERVRHDDLAGALIHYDRALRTVRQARPILFPVLAAAMAEPTVVQAAKPLFIQRAPWTPDFIAVMAETPSAAPDALGQLLIASNLRANVPAERDPLDAALRRLITSGRYSAAYTAYRHAGLPPSSADTVRGGDFETDPVLPPFDWSFASETDLSATIEPRASGRALVLRAANGRSGELARQLLLLRPGPYRLRLTSSSASPDPVSRAVIAVTCATETGPLFQLPLSSTVQDQLGGSFVVPSACEAQFLTITAPAGMGDSDAGVMVDDLVITPARH